MRILITSGGTKVPIDPIRSITNHSSGKFGAQISKAALISNMDVIYLTSSEGLSPFYQTFDYAKKPDLEKDILSLQKLYEFTQQFRDHYIEYRYANYEEYSIFLKKIIEVDKPDIVILAAAVSDYLIENYSSSKIRSNESLNLKLKSTIKWIQKIKEWLPNTFLVGFKLMVNATDSELIKTALDSITVNHADLIVANDLTSLQKHKHEIILVERDGTYEKITDHLAETLINRIIQKRNQ
jgi:phosphopantothenate--cysteine ligase